MSDAEAPQTSPSASAGRAAGPPPWKNTMQIAF